jgi:tRNA A-37 threonylcarbamoyl transferase component Bud32
MIKPFFGFLLGGAELLILLGVGLLLMGSLTVGAVIMIWRSKQRNRVSPSLPQPPLASPPVIAATVALPKCPQCHLPLAPNAPEGLCPACLAKVALGSEPATPKPTINLNPLAGAAPGGRVAPDPAQLAGQFPQLEIIELLGMGGMGMVYKARQPRLDRIVALKILPVESQQHPSFAERFGREAKALAKLNHPGIVNIYDFGQTGQYYYFVMEYVDGMNLRHLLHNQPLEPRQALELVTQICMALQYAHDEGVVHRDIKPENILLNKKGQVKIADFGLAKLLGTAPDTALTMSQAAMGTLNYMAPEQRQNAQTVDHRADIYSLGVVFYEMLTGEVPMGRFEPPSKRVQVDVRLDEVVLKALEREPARRYQQASEVKSGVETITSTPATAPASPPAAPAPVPMVQARFPVSDFFSLAGFFLALWIAGVAVGYMPVLGMSLLAGILVAGTFQLSARLQIQKSRERGLWPQLGELPTVEHVKRLALAGEMKLAIKLYRQIHGVSPANARAAMEKLTRDSTPPTALATGQADLTRFHYSDLFSLGLFLAAFYTTYLVGELVPAMGTLLFGGLLLVGVRHLTSRLQIQKARERALWPQLGEIPTLAHVRRLAQSGEKVLAIKLYRQIHGVSSPEAKEAVKKLAGDVKSSVETITPSMPAAPPGFVSSARKTSNLLVLACVLGACAGLVPGISYTGSYWGLKLIYFQVPDSPMTVNGIESGSPAEQTGFKLFDEIKAMDGVTNVHPSSHQAGSVVGEKHSYTVERGGKEVALNAITTAPQLAAIWYEDISCPIAAALFICIGIVVFATTPVVPPPLWRSISVTIAGLVIAVGLSIAIGAATFNDRVAIYQRWTWLDTGKEYYFQQGLIAIAAAVFVTILGTVEIRQRLARLRVPAGSAK